MGNFYKIIVKTGLKPILFLVRLSFKIGKKMRKKRQETTETKIRFETFLAIASVLIVLGCLAPWQLNPATGYRVNALSDWYAPLAFAGGFVALFGATVTFRLYRYGKFQKYRPYTDGIVGMIGSILALIGSLSFLRDLGSNYVPAWGLYLTIFGAALGILSAVGVFRVSSPRIPKGLSEEGVTA